MNLVQQILDYQRKIDENQKQIRGKVMEATVISQREMVEIATNFLKN